MRGRTMRFLTSDREWMARVLGRRLALGAALLAIPALPGAAAGQSQLTYTHGQTVSPAFEGWEQNEDGSYDFLFGYLNRNWEEELDVPLGAENFFSPGEADRGQPTHFLPRRNRFVFRVRVPADWGDRELVWTVTTQGQTERAYATLRPDYVVDNVVIASETGALGAGTSSPEMRANQPPVVSVEGDPVRTARVGEPVVLVAHVSDDGIPRRAAAAATAAATPDAFEAQALQRAMRPPVRITVGKALGLHFAWFVYRGDGKVTFDPIQVKVWEDTRANNNSPWSPNWIAPPVPPDGRWVVRATFHEPGTYVLRGRADDGALFHDGDVTIHVTP